MLYLFFIVYKMIEAGIETTFVFMINTLLEQY